MQELKYFIYKSEKLSVTFLETMQVKKGVKCDVYEFTDDSEKDLGIIRISAWQKTPRQKVLKWDSTIEGFISGKWKLVIENSSKNKKEHLVWDWKEFSLKIQKWEIIQIIADKNSDLVMYEICYPPYEDGRFLEV